LVDLPLVDCQVEAAVQGVDLEVVPEVEVVLFVLSFFWVVLLAHLLLAVLKKKTFLSREL